ncbi:MAG: DUF1049 domain-containing protein [Microcoleaceae cyanobacterium]
MNIILPLLINLLLAIWIGVIAMISVQNATLVVLKFIVFESIQIPVGVVLALSAVFGIVLGSLVKPLWQLSHLTREE